MVFLQKMCAKQGKLSEISTEVDEEAVHEIMLSMNMKLLHKEKIKLTEAKSFVVLEYGRKAS